MMTRAEAIKLGFKIDNGQAPIAYKGPRFKPTEWHPVHTELEEQLIEDLRSFLRELIGDPHIEYRGEPSGRCGGGLRKSQVAERIKHILRHAGTEEENEDSTIHSDIQLQ